MMSSVCYKVNIADIRYTPTEIVLPVTMITTGVFCGSGGALLYPPDELARSAPAWSGVPVTVGHPLNSAGRPMSAGNAPEKVIGTVQAAQWDGAKLKAELWLNKEQLTVKAPQLLPALTEGRNIEVSTGLFSTDQPVVPPEYYMGRQYNAIVRNIRPDHLAVLLDQRAACSWSDGCGIRNNGCEICVNCHNNKGENNMSIINEEPLEMPKLIFNVNPETIEKVKSHLVANGLTEDTAVERIKRMTAQELEELAENLGHHCEKCNEDNSPLELPELKF